MEIAREAERKPRDAPRPTQSTARGSESRRPERGANPAPGNSNREQSRPQRGGPPGSSFSRPGQPTRRDAGGAKPAYAPRQESKADQDRKKRLRDEGKCFLCESSQHLARDCPQSTTKKPPAGLHAMRLGMMSPVEVRLAALEEGTRAGLFSLIPEKPQSKLEERSVLWEVAIATIRQALPLPWDELTGDAESAFDTNRFWLTEYGGLDSYLLLDRYDKQEYPLSRDQLVDPGFD